MFSMLFTGYYYLIEDQCVVFSKSSVFFFVDFALWLIVSSSLFIGYWRSITKYSVTVLLQSITKYSLTVLLQSITKYSVTVLLQSITKYSVTALLHPIAKYSLTVLLQSIAKYSVTVLLHSIARYSVTVFLHSYHQIVGLGVIVQISTTCPWTS